MKNSPASERVPHSETSAQTHAKTPRRRITRNAALVILLGVLFAAAPFTLRFSPYVLNIFMQAATYSIAVLGMTVVLGYTGQINLAQATFFGLGAYAVGLGTVALGINFWLSLLLGGGVATCAGFVLGLTTLRLGGHYLAMITISFQQIFDLVMVNWADVTRGPDGIAGIERPSLFGYVWPMIALICCSAPSFSTPRSILSGGCRRRVPAAPCGPCAKINWQPGSPVSTPCA